MPTYTATFRTDGEFATFVIEAKNPKSALRAVQDLWDQNQNALTFERYDKVGALNELLISNASGKQVAEWLDEDMHLRLSAEEMRSALYGAIEALKSAPKFGVRELDANRNWTIKECERVLAQAFGEDA